MRTLIGDAAGALPGLGLMEPLLQLLEARLPLARQALRTRYG